MSQVEAPEIDCPKCGELLAFINSRPHWREGELNDFGARSPDYLEWECERCGYAIQTEPLDVP